MKTVEKLEEGLVGPVLRGVDADIIDAVIAAAEIDNPDREVVVEDRGGYVRVHARGRFRLTRETMERILGRPFELRELEPSLSAFAGHVETGDEEWVWRLHTAAREG
ncbi:Toluene-4-monooxygenase system protein D [bacterium HR39]|nr:Toluene-4-monooxygenase system protein D [bacterium HR39]